VADGLQRRIGAGKLSPAALAGTALCTLGLGLAAVGARTGSASAAAARAAGRSVSVSCRGGSDMCTAVLGLAGGASDEKVSIALSDTDLKLVGMVARPAFVHGAYLLSGGAYSLGGSLYTVTLNAVQAIPKGATLSLEFAAPSVALPCRSATKGVSSLSIFKLGPRQTRGAFTCQQANAVASTWALRFHAHEQVKTFSVNEVPYACRLASTLPQNARCDGGGARVKFSAPGSGT
jgi:hypothetical protein